MAFDKYKAGAWTEPETIVGKNISGAWEDCESAKRVISGAWAEIWSAGFGTACNLTTSTSTLTAVSITEDKAIIADSIEEVIEKDGSTKYYEYQCTPNNPTFKIDAPDNIDLSKNITLSFDVTVNSIGDSGAVYKACCVGRTMKVVLYNGTYNVIDSATLAAYSSISEMQNISTWSKSFSCTLSPSSAGIWTDIRFYPNLTVSTGMGRYYGLTSTQIQITIENLKINGTKVKFQPV